MTSQALIAQVLNRDFILAHMELLADALAKNPQLEPVDAFGIPVDGAPLNVERTRDVVTDALTRERAASSGQVGFDQPGATGGAPRSLQNPLDEFVFISHDPVVSLVQSALDERLQPHVVARDTAGRERLAVQPGAIPVTDAHLPGYGPFGENTRERLFGPFEPTDVRWVNSAIAMAIRARDGRHPFRPQPATPVTIAPNARVVLVGDWGSGVPRARAVSTQMRAVLEEGITKDLDQHVIHLGDVYYSGWPREYDRRFLAYWPVHPQEATTIGSWALNANHDMYSGGGGYFDHLLADPRFAAQQHSSFFGLSNEHWQILGLDTGWKEGDLADPQAKWVHDQVHAREHRKTILLTHHQAFSAYDKIAGTLTARLASCLDDGEITAWFWGHEHRCMKFSDHAGVRFGRCIGHGGVPVYIRHAIDDPYPPPATYEYRDRLRAGIDGALHLDWALFGFAVLDFDGPDLHVRYIDENGHQHEQDDIS